MRVLVIGRHGQVAASLAERAPAGLEMLFAARPEIDLARPDTIERAIAAASPDIVVNAAAYTAVDAAEDDAATAQAVNGEAPAICAAAATRAGARLIHLSTDYVFDGTLDRPYREDDSVAPQGVYGATKLAGEEGVRAASGDHAIVRTAWVYGPFGGNFLKTMLRLAETRERLGVVDDQIGCPTSSVDIADALFAMIAAWRDGVSSASGTFHFAGQGQASWAAFAREIFAESGRLSGPCAAVDGIATADWPTRAKRPANSRLDCTRFAEAFGTTAPRWQLSTAAAVQRVLGERARREASAA